MRESKTDRIFNAFNLLFMILVLLIVVFPMYFVIIASVSDPSAVATGKVILYPVGFSMESYQNVFKNNSIWMGYLNSIINTVLGTTYNLLLTIPAAYVLSKKNLLGHTVISWFFFITMYFSGGLIPTYLLYKDLGLMNSRWALILGAGVSCHNLIIARQFFSSNIPESLYESARIDGATEYRMFFQIALPLSKAIVSVLVLYYAVGHWNEYFKALIYMTDSQLFPLQLVLRKLLLQEENALSNIEMNSMSLEDIVYEQKRAYMAYSMKFAMIFISSAPLLIAYPFVQKYFVKGVMIGSVKG